MGGGQSTQSGSKSITDHDRAVADLKSQMAKLDRLQKQMVTKNKQEEVVMKRLLKEGRRESAMSILKLKKIRESQVNKCQATYLKLEEMVMSIESAQVNVSVMESLKIGNESLKQLNNIMSVEAVEAILSDHDEEIEKQREIDVLLAGEFAQGIDDELESELKALMEEEGISSPAGSKTTDKPIKDPLQDLPDAPRHVVEPTVPVKATKTESPSRENDYDALDELASLNAPTHKVKVLEEEEQEEEGEMMAE